MVIRTAVSFINRSEARVRPWLMSASLVCLLLVLVQPSMAKEPLVLGVHPYLSIVEIKKRFAPLAAYLSKAIGQPVKVRVASTYDEHIEAIGNNQLDIAFLGPAGYVRLTQQYGAKQPLAQMEISGKSQLFGVIAVRRNSKLKKLSELKKMRFAYGDPDSTMSHVVPRYMLIRAGIPKGLPEQYKYLGSHRNVALAVLAGRYDAGAMKMEVYDELKSHGLQVLKVSPGLPDHVFVARANLPHKLASNLRQTMLRLHKDPSGESVLGSIHKNLTALNRFADADFHSLRRMMETVDAAR